MDDSNELVYFLAIISISDLPHRLIQFLLRSGRHSVWYHRWILIFFFKCNSLLFARRSHPKTTHKCLDRLMVIEMKWRRLNRAIEVHVGMCFNEKNSQSFASRRECSDKWIFIADNSIYSLIQFAPLSKRYRKNCENCVHTLNSGQNTWRRRSRRLLYWVDALCFRPMKFFAYERVLTSSS